MKPSNSVGISGSNTSGPVISVAAPQSQPSAQLYAPRYTTPAAPSTELYTPKTTTPVGPVSSPYAKKVVDPASYMTKSAYTTPSNVGPSPPTSTGGGGILQYDPNAPVYAGPEGGYKKVGLGSVDPADISGKASYQEQALEAYGKDSPAARAARAKAMESAGGSGLLFSDIAQRGAEGAAFDVAERLIAPDVQARQDALKSQQQFQQQGSLAEQAGGIGMQSQLKAGEIQGALGEQQFGQQSELAKQQYGQQQGLSAQQAAQLGKLSSQEYGQQKGLSAQQYGQQLGLGQQQFTQQQAINEQMNKYDTATRASIQGFERESQNIANNFQREMIAMNFGQDMEAGLLTTMQGMLNNGLQSMTNLAMSGEATPAEVAAIQESLKNSLTTFTNIWKGSTGNTENFDFSGIS